MPEKMMLLRCGSCGSELQFANVQLVPLTENQLMGVGVHVEVKCPCGTARLVINCPLRNTSLLPNKMGAKLGPGTYTIQIQE